MSGEANESFRMIIKRFFFDSWTKIIETRAGKNDKTSRLAISMVIKV
ncbi:hypothetical protein P872_08645 [Rhodonellum psychrophilum GCM71 = DSM 17998]|uniref:Uncharacterized protein n=1 Tax=Rhodonellum psychrophilum GCM71 = DSM 17998 TaxID=1123057 RepID=U5C1J4_9BACT|nr:hypothetical protein P872_08645 [Rhodonellum psychrophilum GCM71 = DSM 17998]